MKKEIAEDLKNIAQIGYCHTGMDIFLLYLNIMKDVSVSKEIRQIFNFMIREVEQANRMVEEYYTEMEKVQ